MKNKLTKEVMQVKVGGFILCGIALIVFAIMLLGSRSGFLKKQYHLYCYFDDVTSLAVGAPVKLAGLNAGIVDGITFVNHKSVPVTASEDEFSDVANLNLDSGGNTVKETGVKVRVSLKIDHHYQNRIRSDSVASVITQGLLGDGLIFISVGSEDHPILKNDEEITEVRNPNSFAHLQRKGEMVVNDAHKLMGNLNAILEEVRKGNGLAHKLIYDPEAGKLFGKMNKVADNLDETTAHFSSITGKIDDGKGTLGLLVNDPAVYNDLKTLLGKANRNKLVRSVIRYTLSTHDVEEK